VNEAGYPRTGNGSGNGSPPRTNAVKVSGLYARCRAQIEAQYPRLVREQFFPSIEAYMVICDVEIRALYVGGFTYLLNTPDDFEPPITLYFTYANGTVMLQAVWAAD
jgi:hypothetical protein